MSLAIIYAMTLSCMVTCTHDQPQQQQQHDYDLQQLPTASGQQTNSSSSSSQHPQSSHRNLSIMHNAIQAQVPVPLQNAISACCDILHEFYVANTNQYMLSTNVVGRNLHWITKDFLNIVLLNLDMIKVEIENVNGQRDGLSYNRKYNLIVIDSTEALRQLDPAKTTQLYDLQEYYLVYFMHISRFSNVTEILNEVFSYFWDNYLINVSIVKVNGDAVSSVDVYTYFPFRDEQSCGMPRLKRINFFNGKWLNPLHTHIFPEKLYNLHSCPLRIAVWNTPPYLSYEPNDQGNYDIDYFEAKLLIALADSLNFTLKLLEPPNDEQRGKVLPNGTTTGALAMLQKHIADISLGSFRYTLERSEVLTAALPYYQTWQIYGILKASQAYSSLEILAYAFDYNTWICVCLSLQLAFAVIYLMRHFYGKSKFLRIILGYPAVRTPARNILAIFLGQPLTQQPLTNFPRYIIFCWFMYGIWMRTAYQSLLFQLLKGNLYHDPPQTLTDLIENNCILVCTEVTYDSVFTVERIGQGLIETIKIKNVSEQSTYFYLEQHQGSQCLAGMGPKDYLTYHVNREHKPGLFFVLPEKIFTQHITMYFSKHSFLINRLNFILINLRSMGLINFWAEQSLDTRYLGNIIDKEYKQIKFINIQGVFVIYMVLIYFAIIVFGLEYIWVLIRKYYLRYKSKRMYVK